MVGFTLCFSWSNSWRAANCAEAVDEDDSVAACWVDGKSANLLMKLMMLL